MKDKAATRPERAYVTSTATRAIRRGALIILALGVLLTGVRYPALPEQVPTHFNFAGEPDAWGARWNVLLLAFAAVVVVGGTVWVSHYPQVFNYPRQVTAENAHAVYRAGEELAVWVAAACSLLMTSLLVVSLFPESQWITENGITMAMTYSMLALFGALIAGVVRILRA